MNNIDYIFLKTYSEEVKEGILGPYKNQNKEYKEALKIQEKAIKLIEKPSADMLEHYGDMLYKLNRIAEAKTYWQKAKDAGQSGTALDEKIESGKL